MRVLFVPGHRGGVAHRLPLLALSRRLKETSCETAFLIHPWHHKMVTLHGEHVLDHPYEGTLRSELAAYAKFRPDVVVDDFNFMTRFATAFSGIPRVTVQRTGMFPGYVPRHPGQHHSAGLVPQRAHSVEMYPDVTALGQRQPKVLSDFFEADVKIVPGIRTIEVLPEAVSNDPSYRYSGPLLSDDLLMHHEGLARLRWEPSGSDLNEFRAFGLLEKFFDLHRDRKKVWVTCGTVARPAVDLCAGVRALLNGGIAVVSSVRIDGLTDRQEALYYLAEHLPLHLVCSRVDVAVHHCGNGTYHYPLLHEIPSVTVGTGCYDRDDVALRLQELGAATHVPPPDACEDFAGRFTQAVAAYLEDGRARAARTSLAALRAEIDQTVAAFNCENVVRSAVVTRASMNSPTSKLAGTVPR